MPIDKINLPYHTNYKIEPEIPANQKFSAEELNQIAGKIDEVIDVVNINVADIVILKSDNLNIKNDILNLKAKDVILQNKIDQLEQNDILFDTRIDILEDTQYIWNSTNRQIEVYRGGSLFSTVSLVSLDNEGTDLRYNSDTKSLELYNDDGELLDSIPVEDFVGNVATQLTLSSNTLSLKDSQGNVLSSVGFQVSNIGGLTNLLANLDTRITNEEILRASEDLKKLDKPTVDGTWVVTRTEGVSGYADASTLGKNIFNANLVLTTDRGQNLGGYKLSFTNGRFSVPTLEMEITSANSVPNKIWNDGVNLKFTNNAGINYDVGSNISNADLSNVSARTFTQGNAFTWNTNGFNYFLKGLPNKTGNSDYNKVIVEHNTTGEVATKSIDIVSYSDLSAVFSGTVIPLNKLSGAYQMTVRNYTAYTTSNLVVGGWAVIRINTTSEPTISGGTKIQGFAWLAGSTMYLYVRYNGSFVEYFFTY